MIISIIVVICCLIMGYIDAIISPAYHIKSIIKIILFLTIPNIYMYKTKEYSGLVKFKKKNFLISLALGLGVFLIILLIYFISSKIFDFSAISTTLSANIGVNANNIIFVATYIALINSLLEEFFFRGFAFFSLRKHTSRRYAYIFSSIMFALYHVAMMIGWFDIVVFILAVLGLFIGGIIFIFVNEKNGDIFSSWLVHMFANFAINLIGFSLFGLI